MATASSVIEVPVFIDTSLGTHVAISVSPHLTVSKFKRIFENVHLNCYPGLGNIEVDGIMVKRKSYLYHLSASMPIKHAFQGYKGTWFVYIKAYPSDKNISSTPQAQVVHGNSSENRTEVKCRKSRKNVMRKELNSSYVGPASERRSESILVSGIIKKYFSVHDDEVTSKHQVPNYEPKTPPTLSSVRTSRNQNKFNGVGERFVIAANSVGISISDKKPLISLCKYKCDESSGRKSSSFVRHPVFELGEE